MFSLERKNRSLSNEVRAIATVLVATTGATTACGSALISEKPITPPERLPKDILSEEELKAAGVEISNSTMAKLFLRKAFLKSEEAQFLCEPEKRRSLKIFLIDEPSISVETYRKVIEEQYNSEKEILQVNKERLEELKSQGKITLGRYEEISQIIADRESRLDSKKQTEREEAEEFLSSLKKGKFVLKEMIYNLRHLVRENDDRYEIEKDGWPAVEDEYWLLVTTVGEYKSYPDTSIFSTIPYTTTILKESYSMGTGMVGNRIRHGLKHLIHNERTSPNNINVDELVKRDLERAAEKNQQGNDEDYFVVLVSPSGVTISQVEKRNQVWKCRH